MPRPSTCGSHVRALAGAALLVCLPWALCSCASVAHAVPVRDPSPAHRPARVMFVGAHPDDEAMVGPVLAWLCKERKARCHFVVLSEGEESGCVAMEGCDADLVAQRRREMRRVADGFGATLALYRFQNLPFHFLWPPPFEAALEAWRAQGAPVDVVAREIRAFRPDLIVSLDDEHGFTGHPEHRLAGWLARRGAARAAERDAALEGEPYETPRLWLAQNRRFPMTTTGIDPKEPDLVFDVSRRCGRRACREVAAELAALHESQQPYMGFLRAGQLATGSVWLAEVRP